jgi:DNA-binding LacI/PurR family transcriptional regulator
MAALTPPNSNGQTKPLPLAEVPRATLEMVAAVAGVSRGTASRVLNGATNVSEKAVDAVTRAARELNYRPNAMARSLVTGRTGLIGLVINIAVERLFGDPFFAQLLGGAEAVFAEADAAVVLSVLTDDRELDRLLDLVSGSLDGVLVVYGQGDEPLSDGLLKIGKPVVFAGRTPIQGNSTLSYVDSDSATGARAAVQLLIEKGRRHIATIAGPQSMAAGVDRLQGWREALAAAGRPAPDEAVAYGDFTRIGGAAAMAELLDRGQPLDAVFVTNDLMAIGVYEVLHQRGLHIPDDVAVVGFDDIPDAARMRPPLTTVAQPVAEIGRQMATLLVNAMNGDDTPHHIILKTSLSIRASSG